MSDYLYDENGKQLAWIENGDIFPAAPEKRKIATVSNGQLYSLRGEPLGLFLVGTGVVGLDGNTETTVELETMRNRVNASGSGVDRLRHEHARAQN